MKLVHEVIGRKNTLSKDKYEWALQVRFDEGDAWTICVWQGKKKPNDTVIYTAVAIMERSMRVFYDHIDKPAGITSITERER